MTVPSKRWDVAEHLKCDEDIAAYLQAAMEDGDPALLAAALDGIRRAKWAADSGH